MAAGLFEFLVNRNYHLIKNSHGTETVTSGDAATDGDDLAVPTRFKALSVSAKQSIPVRLLLFPRLQQDELPRRTPTA